MLITAIQCILILVVLVTLMGSIAESNKDRRLSQQLTAICAAAVLALVLSLFA